MTQEAIVKMEEYLQQIGKKLGIAGKEVWSILVRQQIIEGITGCVISLILLSVGIVCGVVLYKHHKKDRLCEEDDFMIWAVLALIIIVFLVALPVSVLNLINPQYYALREIFGAIK